MEGPVVGDRVAIVGPLKKSPVSFINRKYELDHSLAKTFV